MLLAYDAQAESGMDTSSTYLYYDQPCILAIAPLFGNSVGGTEVTISGGAANEAGNFTDWSTTVCKFGTIGPISAVFFSATELHCRAPAKTIGSIVEVKISLNNFDYT